MNAMDTRTANRFYFYSSLDECAKNAATIFLNNRWRWSRCEIPDKLEIKETLQHLRDAANAYAKQRGREDYRRAESGRLIYCEGFYGVQRPRKEVSDFLSYEPFNRKTFNPVKNAKHRKSLAVLRSVGSHRAFLFGRTKQYPNRHDRKHHVSCYGSSALCWLGHDFRSLRERDGNEVFIDLGCGNSPDALVATDLGYQSYAFDLFPPRSQYLDDLPFMPADVVERIPLDDLTVDFAISQAMIDLVPLNERAAFYREVDRVLKVGGVFTQIGISLHCGHGYKQSDELARARAVSNWKIESAPPGGFRAQKVAEAFEP